MTERVEAIMELVCDTCHWPYVEPDEDSLERRCEGCRIEAAIKTLTK